MTSEREALLEVARDTLRRDVMPALFGDARYKGAMLANTLAILQRSLGNEGRGTWDERQALRQLCPAAADDEARQRQLVEDIRRGGLDDDDRRLVAELLEPRVRARLAISQPDYRRVSQSRT